jgi:ATP-dependent DNA helicase RecG
VDSGTLMMIRESVEHPLPEPDFAERAGEFTVTVWRDWLTEKMVVTLGLNERQVRVVGHLKSVGRITNQEYQQITGATKKTASRNLADMAGKGVAERIGTTGRGAFYVLARKRDIKGTKGSSSGAGRSPGKRPTKGTKGPFPRRRRGGAGT